jgi:hypothetical protein
MLILHSGRQYKPDIDVSAMTIARYPNCNTAIESSAQSPGRTVWIKPEDGGQGRKRAFVNDVPQDCATHKQQTFA